MRLLLPSLLLLLSTACAGDEMGFEPNCDDGSCDEKGVLAPVEFCRVDVGLTWDCEEIDASHDLCDYDGNYRIGGGVVQLNGKEGAVCNINAISHCHALHVAQSGDHLVCEAGPFDILVGFDGVPLREGGMEVCEGLEHWEGYRGYFHDRSFSVGKEGASCLVTGDAFDLPNDDFRCHSVVISEAGMDCEVSSKTTRYPFVR